MYELKKNLKRYLRVNLLGLGPCLIKKRIYRAAVSQRLRNTALDCMSLCWDLWHRQLRWWNILLTEGGLTVQNMQCNK